jgi:hypothetical protein
MTSTPNPYCEALGINIPKLEVAKESPDTNYYALLIVVLLERGQPVTLQEAAERFDEAGVAPANRALASLKRCKPGRSPIFRDGDLYALDPHDAEADLWAFRLGLRPPKAAALRVVRQDVGPLPSVETPLTVAHLDEAWRDGVPSNSSAQRIALCVLDAHGEPMEPADVISFVSARGQYSPLSVDSAEYWRRGAAVRVQADGLWEINPDHDALRSARQAVIDKIETARRWAHMRTDPAVAAANRRHFERKRKAHAEEFAGMRRVLLHAFPTKKPEILALVDVAQREVMTFTGDEIVDAKRRLADYEIISAIDVRQLLRALGFEPENRRLGELGPPQKTRTLNRRGRTLKITASLLVQGSCGIGRPFGDEKKMRQYFEDGKLTKLRRRLEADAKSLYALYQYGRLHGYVRLRWGFLDEHLPAPWVHRDEMTLYNLKDQAHERGVPLEVVVGSAPGWADPWSRLQRVHVQKEPEGWRSCLVGDNGYVIDEDEIQLARLSGESRSGHSPRIS